jgi:predicted fused transcriptional regulator/phosphomethylpyrimidine kinase/predicted transcriptional regulator
MALRLPSEIVVERFLPTARTMLARELSDRGFTQQEIATFLGVTQAAVSNYLSAEATVEPRFADDERMQRTIDRIAADWAAGDLDEYGALAALLDLVEAFEDRGPICAVHEKEMPALEGLGCDLCVRGTDDALDAERAVLRSVRRATRRLSGEPAVAAHIPNVGTNVAMALSEPTDETDVAAIPGRLHAMRGQVRVPSEPEFGASRHVAGTLLIANECDATVRGALNFATSPALLAAARERDVDPVEFDADYEDRDAELRAAFAEGVPRVAYHEGAFGIEPVSYVFGESAEDAASFAVALTRAVESDDADSDPVDGAGGKN